MSAAAASMTVSSVPFAAASTKKAPLPCAQGRFPATILSLQSLSPYIRQIVLQVAPAHLALASFRPGQWVDFHIPDAAHTVGGFSICSTPSRLAEEGVIELAVKRSTHPPAAWVHDEAKVGTMVELEVGGSFSYDCAGPEQAAPSVFIVGGVGITPIVSMVRSRMSVVGAPSTTVMYSAKTEVDLVYRRDLNSFRSIEGFTLYLSATIGAGQHAESWRENGVNTGRVPLDLLRRVLDDTDRDAVHVYLCGPPKMVEEILPIIAERIAKERIHYEKWW